MPVKILWKTFIPIQNAFFYWKVLQEHVSFGEERRDWSPIGKSRWTHDFQGIFHGALPKGAWLLQEGIEMEFSSLAILLRSGRGVQSSWDSCSGSSLCALVAYSVVVVLYRCNVMLIQVRRRVMGELRAATLGQRCSATSDQSRRGWMLLCLRAWTPWCCLSPLGG